jgi:hypothetical protein
MKKINGIEVNAKRFAYDGCHKIYLLNDKESEKDAKELGYDIYSIKYLIDCFLNSCPLRFINFWNENFDTIVSQGEETISFENFNISDDIKDNGYASEYDITIKNKKLDLKLVLA